MGTNSSTSRTPNSVDAAANASDDANGTGERVLAAIAASSVNLNALDHLFAQFRETLGELL